MIINRDKAPSHRTSDLAKKLSDLCGPCIGCEDCKGMCRDLFELLVVPEIIIAKGLSA